MKTENELENWKEIASQHACNERYYRSLLIEIGNMFGIVAKIQDDGNISHDVIVDKLPQVVAEYIANLHYQLEQSKRKRIQDNNRGMLEKIPSTCSATD
jgi:hypothetical protein